MYSQNDRAHRAAIEIGLLQLSQLLSGGETDEATLAQLQDTLATTIQHGLSAVAIENNNYQNWLALARLYGELAGVGVEGAEAAARSAYEEAQKNSPTNPLPFLGLAQLELQASNDVGAREYLLRALEVKPDLAAALFLLSQIEARAGDLPAARARAEAVVQVAPNDSLGWYNLGTIYYAEENYEFAGAAFERAVGIQNDYANALFLLSASYAQLGFYEEGATALRAVAALNPSEASLPDMIAALERGENPFAEEVSGGEDQ
jgi:tetratricopeptide (TPR) repeat protein